MYDNFEDPYPSSERKIFCNTCRNINNHFREFGPQFQETGDGCGEFTINIYNLWACAGCEGMTFEIMTSFANQIGATREIHYESYLYPRRKEMHSGRKTYKNLPKDLRNVYSEIIYALNHDLTLLCSIGVRSLIEGICINRKALGINLPEKINALKNELPENLVNSLKVFSSIGNDAAHQLIPTDVFILKTSIEVLEDLMNYFYRLEDKAKNIGQQKSANKSDLNDNDFDFEKNSYGDIN